MKNISIINTENYSNKLRNEIQIIFDEKVENNSIENYINNFSIKESKIYCIPNNEKILIFSKVENKEIKKIVNIFSNIIFHINSHFEHKEFFFNCNSFDEKVQKELLFELFKSQYSFDKYLTDKKESTNSIEFITKLNNTTIEQIKIISKQQSHCKDLVNSNADEITSEFLHNELESFSKEYNLKFKAIVGEELKELGHNLHYNVGKSAKIAPRMLCCKYNGNPNLESTIALVGKGVTFDTGGLNLKPTGAIEDMKIDMGGAGSVFSAFKALVELKVKQNIVLVLGCCENSIDSNSYKVGDVFTSRQGMSVEVTNTDAEGRLVLADCIDYVQDKYNVDEMIDCATLTGACMIALGLSTVGTFSNSNSFCEEFLEQTTQSHESFWRLPILDEHREVLKSQIADCSNCGSGALRKFGGASSAAAFLEKFVKEDTKWIHLDIAGPSYNSKNLASGVSVRSIVEFYLNK